MLLQLGEQSPPILKDLVTKSLSCNITNHNSTPESYYLQHLLASCHACTVQRLSLAPTECSITFLEAVQSLMPHWTPSQGDNVVYATIEEALSGSIGDVNHTCVR